MKIVKNLLLLTLFTLVFNPTIAKEKVLSIGLLKYGSVNWEMDIIEHNNLDKKNKTGDVPLPFLSYSFIQQLFIFG